MPFLLQGVSLLGLLGALLACAWPVYICAETALVMAIVMMSRMSLTGHIFIGLGDAIIGLLLGLGTVSLTGLCLLPLLQALLGKHSRLIAGVLIVVAVLVSVASSTAALWPYSQDAPKRLMLGHVHYVAPANRQQSSLCADEGCIGSGQQPAMRVVNSSWVIASSDSNPAGWLADAMGFSKQDAQVPTGNEWGIIYPVSKLLDYQLYPAKPNLQVVKQLPHLKLVGKRRMCAGTYADADEEFIWGESVDEVASCEGTNTVTEVQFESFTEKPCWGTLKLYGADIESWSLHPGVWYGAANFTAGRQRGSGDVLITRQHTEGKGLGHVMHKGPVGSVVIKWTNEQRQGPLHWLMRVRYHEPQQQRQHQQLKHSATASGESSNSKLLVELHVGYVEQTTDLAEVISRMPDWATLSYQATTYISQWTL
eukprot:GHRR01009178.1.p1 GENE.GHRR01009178.1~~GHRR01009178.1.p1  ORF type:complete len:424 (+),score=114.37 GHRR01009178.1:229-1500(+)